MKMESKKCYIAGKITGLPEDEYRNNFFDAVVEVRRLGFDPINHVTLPHNHGRTWKDYMKECLTALLQCDCLYALRSWRESKGATIEVKTAMHLGIDIIYQK